MQNKKISLFFLVFWGTTRKILILDLGLSYHFLRFLNLPKSFYCPIMEGFWVILQLVYIVSVTLIYPLQNKWSFFSPNNIKR